MKLNNIYLGALVGLLAFASISCQDDVAPEIEELKLSRVLTVTGLEARIRNQRVIELTWNLRDDSDFYIVEFSEDSLEFNEIIRTDTVMSDEIPFQATFFGDTQYSARVKGINEDATVEDSFWEEVAIKTDPENIYADVQDYDILWNEASLRWNAAEGVTRIVLNPGNIEKSVTSGEDVAGVASVSGLTGETAYTATLYTGNSPRGTMTFETLIDPTGANVTVLEPTDDLNAAIIAASPEQILLLNPGEYSDNSGIFINKSITIRGQYPYDKPIIHNGFSLDAGATDVTFRDLEMDGEDGLTATVVQLATAGVNHNSVTFSGCYVHDYSRQLIYGNVAAKLTSFSVDNSIVSDFLLGGGDFIDFRTAHVESISLTNSTFSVTPKERDFIRVDASGYSDTGLNTDILIDHCTLYGVADATRRMFYVRFVSNSISVENSIFANTSAYYAKEAAVSVINFSSNNYFDAEGFYTAGYREESGFQFDATGTTDDPEFADPENGDFTVGNQDVTDQGVGDPRWL